MATYMEMSKEELLQEKQNWKPALRKLKKKAYN